MSGRNRSIHYFVTSLVILSGTSLALATDFPLSGKTVWTDKVVERIPLNTSHLEALEVTTHNGFIKYSGERRSSDSYVEVTKKTGGRSMQEAEDAFDALEVFVEPGRGGVTKIGWRWSVGKESKWRASVSFHIVGPAQVDIQATTHNGPISATGVDGSVSAQTHNGSVAVSGSGDSLTAVTHNGNVKTEFVTGEMVVTTHNGSIEADLRDSHVVNGKIDTHNGSVNLVVDSNVSTSIDMETRRGKIKCDVPSENRSSSKHRKHVRATIGDGVGDLTVRTHNGSVSVKSSSQ